MQIFDLQNDIETPILTKWIDCLHGFKICKACLETPYLESWTRSGTLEAWGWAQRVSDQIRVQDPITRWTLFANKMIDRRFPSSVGFTIERNSWACRQVLGAGLESLCTVKGTVGSNPTLSAIYFNFYKMKINVKICFDAIWTSGAMKKNIFVRVC